MLVKRTLKQKFHCIVQVFIGLLELEQSICQTGKAEMWGHQTHRPGQSAWRIQQPTIFYSWQPLTIMQHHIPSSTALFLKESMPYSPLFDGVVAFIYKKKKTRCDVSAPLRRRRKPRTWNPEESEQWELWCFLGITECLVALAALSGEFERGVIFLMGAQRKPVRNLSPAIPNVLYCTIHNMLLDLKTSLPWKSQRIWRWNMEKKSNE